MTGTIKVGLAMELAQHPKDLLETQQPLLTHVALRDDAQPHAGCLFAPEKKLKALTKAPTKPNKKTLTSAPWNSALSPPSARPAHLAPCLAWSGKLGSRRCEGLCFLVLGFRAL